MIDYLFPVKTGIFHRLPASVEIPGALTDKINLVIFNNEIIVS